MSLTFADQFSDGPPLDGSSVILNELTTFHLGLVGFYYSLAALGIVFSTVCLIFNFTQRNKKYAVYANLFCTAYIYTVYRVMKCKASYRMC